MIRVQTEEEDWNFKLELEKQNFEYSSTTIIIFQDANKNAVGNPK